MPLSRPKSAALKAARSRKTSAEQVAHILLDESIDPTPVTGEKVEILELEAGISELARVMYLNRKGELKTEIPKTIKRLIRHGSGVKRNEAAWGRAHDPGAQRLRDILESGIEGDKTALLIAHIPDGPEAHQLIAEIHLAALVFFHTSTPEQHQRLRTDPRYRDEYLIHADQPVSPVAQQLQQWFIDYVGSRRDRLSEIAEEQLPGTTRVKELEFVGRSRELYGWVSNTARYRAARKSLNRHDFKTPEEFKREQAVLHGEYEHCQSRVDPALKERARVLNKLAILYHYRGIEPETTELIASEARSSNPPSLIRQARVQAVQRLMGSLKPTDKVFHGFAEIELGTLLRSNRKEKSPDLSASDAVPSSSTAVGVMAVAATTRGVTAMGGLIT